MKTGPCTRCGMGTLGHADWCESLLDVVDRLMSGIDAALPASEPLTYHQRRLVKAALVEALHVG